MTKQERDLRCSWSFLTHLLSFFQCRFSLCIHFFHELQNYSQYFLEHLQTLIENTPLRIRDNMLINITARWRSHYSLPSPLRIVSLCTWYPRAIPPAPRPASPITNARWKRSATPIRRAISQFQSKKKKISKQFVVQVRLMLQRPGVLCESDIWPRCPGSRIVVQIFIWAPDCYLYLSLNVTELDDAISDRLTRVAAMVLQIIQSLILVSKKTTKWVGRATQIKRTLEREWITDGVQMIVNKQRRTIALMQQTMKEREREVCVMQYIESVTLHWCCADRHAKSKRIDMNA